MRLATFIHREQEQIGVVFAGEEATRIMPIRQFERFPATMRGLIVAGPDAIRELGTLLDQEGIELLDLDAVRLLAPIPRPPKNIICLGLNYAGHSAEQGVAVPENMVVFTKAPTTVNAPYGEIPYDATFSDKIDWEVELGVVIGRPGRHIAVDEALAHVFGYTIVNDISARDVQRRHKQYFLGKSLDGSCPMGPWLVTADEIPDPQELLLRSRVNGELKQEGNTADQVFPVAEAITILSRGMTLEAGDVIATGTPAGVGMARTPPEFLSPGDVVECEIEGIGSIRNRISAPG